MRRSGRSPRLAVALALTSVPLAALALPEKGGPLHLRVEEEGGTTYVGKARYKKDGVEVDTNRGTKKVPYKRVVSLEEVNAEALPPEAERPLDRAEFETRKKAIEEKPDPSKEGQAWARLGTWAKKRGLDPEAKLAWEKAAELVPDDPEARRGLGQAKDDDGTWKDVRVVFEKKRAACGKTPEATFELGRWADRNGLDDEAMQLAFPLSQKNAYDKALLAFLRPVTDKRRPTTPLAFPLRGRWRASADPTHHHELKSFAVYALDLYGDVDGKAWKGSGKKLEEHYAWAQPIYACADGLVVEVREGFPDNPVNQCEGKQEKHNGVYVLHENNEASWYLHTLKGSITVKNGDRVKKGQVIGKVGNSGGSAQPHLHFTLVAATHAISIPWRWDDYLLVVEDGTKVRVKRARPVEGQLVESLPEAEAGSGEKAPPAKEPEKPAPEKPGNSSAPK